MVAASLDIVGQKFGWLTVLGKGKGKLWNLECKCGKIISLYRSKFDTLKTPQRSCGCARSRRFDISNALVGRRYGNLVVKEVTDKRKGKLLLFKCLCDCGRTCECTSQKLRSGCALNCGDLSHPKYLQYPPTPSPYPDEASMILEKYLYLTKLWNNGDSAVEDYKTDQLIRAAWIVCCRRQQGENISEIQEKRIILKYFRYAKLQVYWQRAFEKNGGILYNSGVCIKQIGDVMTDLTSSNEVVSTEGKTQPDILVSKRRIKFRRC